MASLFFIIYIERYSTRLVYRINDSQYTPPQLSNSDRIQLFVMFLDNVETKKKRTT